MAQDIKFFNQRPIKNIFIGIGGDGGIGSINQEKLRLMSFDLLMIQKIGLGYSKQWFNDSVYGNFISIPANLTFAIGKRNHMFEVGVGSIFKFKRPHLPGMSLSDFWLSNSAFKVKESVFQNVYYNSNYLEL